MTYVEIIVIVGGLLFGYWIVTILINKKLVSSTNSNFENNPENGPQHNRAHHAATDSDRSGEEDHIPTSWFRILEVSEGASPEQVVEAYKHKISQYHPDKVAQMGAEIRELAEAKSKQINAAYDYAIKLQR